MYVRLVSPKKSKVLTIPREQGIFGRSDYKNKNMR